MALKLPADDYFYSDWFIGGSGIGELGAALAG